MLDSSLGKGENRGTMREGDDLKELPNVEVGVDVDRKLGRLQPVEASFFSNGVENEESLSATGGDFKMSVD